MAVLAFQVVVEKCEQFIRAGRIHPARKLLNTVDATRATRSEKRILAQLARRLGEIQLGLRLLQPLVRPVHAGAQPRELECAEFANLLCLNGNLSEALALLPHPERPESLLAKAWCYFESWDHALAVPLLRRALRQTKGYEAEALTINLGEALIEVGEWKGARDLLDDAIAGAQYERLLANALHVRARGFADYHQFARSKADLARAEKLFGDSPTLDAFLIRRQIGINEALQKKDLAPLRKLAAEARARGSWESLREIDFQSLKIRLDPKIFARLYFGTPFPNFRRRLRERFDIEPGEESVWGDSRQRAVDFENDFALTPQLQRLARTLVCDFYLPQTVGRLFAGIFPGEHYDWRYSPNKVHQALARFRAFLKAEGLPLTITHDRSFYSLARTGAIGVRVRVEGDSADWASRLRQRFGDEFSAGDARAYLSEPKTTVNRFLAEALEAGFVERRGVGRGTRYRFKH